MAEQIAGPSIMPVVPSSTSAHKESLMEGDSSSSASASPALTALETLPSIEPPISELETPQPTQAATAPTDQQQQTSLTPSKPSPQASSDSATIPPRTSPGPPSSLKRNKVPTKGTKSVKDIQIDEHAPWHGVVVDYVPQKEQAVIFPAKMVYSSPNIPYNDEGWAFQRAMGYSDYIGSGFVFINVHGEKRKRNVKDNTYVFIVLEGAVEVLIHQTSYAVSAGGVFVVPRGNFYTIRNISAKEAKLFFMQARKPEPEIIVDTRGTNRPTSKAFLLAEWFLKHLVTYLIRFRSKAFDWYWNNLARYQHHITTRRLYFLFFVFGLMIRRLPFIGSPPIFNIQIVRLR